MTPYSNNHASDHALEPPKSLSGLSLLRVKLTTPANWIQLIQFGVVGLSGFVVNFAVYAACVKALHLHYLVAAVVAWSVAVTNNFFWNRHWTFRHKRDARHYALQWMRFILVSAAALVPNLLILRILVEGGMDKILAQVIAVCLVTPMSFLGNRLWSFR
jgi:dolichol-phosphate mannosyltransferase